MRTPWAEWLRAGALAFGLKPAEFWRLSLAEWRALAGGGGAPSARELAALMRRHPDRAAEGQ